MQLANLLCGPVSLSWYVWETWRGFLSGEVKVNRALVSVNSFWHTSWGNACGMRKIWDFCCVSWVSGNENGFLSESDDANRGYISFFLGFCFCFFCVYESLLKKHHGTYRVMRLISVDDFLSPWANWTSNFLSRKSPPSILSLAALASFTLANLHHY